ncbi:Cytochrome c family protein [Minicystis rosea]|nr:Cytochrome c family protein [Minicystis rosea]
MTWCGTCHGDGSGPRPTSGAHAEHARFCVECHRVPEDVVAPGHLDGVIEIAFSGLATASGASPSWDATTKTCAGTHCHAGSTPTWQKPSGAATCATCHGAPPASHQRWIRVAEPASCGACHPVPPDPRHLDGTITVASTIACDACHGHGPAGAPPVALDGSSDPTTRGAGAHRRHLDETLGDRIGRVVPCARCHPIPASVTAPGHLDTSAPADVIFAGGGTYDPAAGSCVVGCHWDRDPGPAWTDASGAARACDACHGFPPVLMRDGTPHTTSAPALTACVACHVYTSTTHVDGHVDLVP